MQRVDENEVRLEEAQLTPSNTAEITRIETEIEDDKERLKEKEIELASFSLMPKIEEEEAELGRDEE